MKKLETMHPYRCRCGFCLQEHRLEMLPSEFRELVSLSRLSLDADGFLNIDCNQCTPFKYWRANGT
jgi:hypothetical protein